MRSSFVYSARPRPWIRLCGALIVVMLLAAGSSAAQPSSQADSPWSARTRATLTGTSDSSDPDGYTVYSGFGFEVSVRRDLGRRFGVEVSAGLESREVDTAGSGAARRVNLGSIEVLPVNVLFQMRWRNDARVRPYAGAGGNLTIFWEKSGALDSTDLTPGGGLAVQFGTDIVLSRSALLNFDVKWNQLATDLEADGTRIARFDIHPLTLGFGFGFRF